VSIFFKTCGHGGLLDLFSGVPAQMIGITGGEFDYFGPAEDESRRTEYALKVMPSVFDQARSKRSRFMTLFQAATKSCRNFSRESAQA
jgi:hypothetical protein